MPKIGKPPGKKKPHLRRYSYGGKGITFSAVAAQLI